MTDAYIGTETGVLKGVDFSKNVFQNYNSISALDRTQEISRICRIDVSKIPARDDNSESNNHRSSDEAVLCALVNRQLKLFDPSNGEYTTLFTCEGGRGAIKGFEQLESGEIVTCVESGEVSLWNMDGFTKTVTVNAGDNVCRMRISPTKPNTIATGGRENPLKLWDLHKPEQPVFASKNVKNDWLDLRVPIWETDFRFSPTSEAIMTCTGHQHIRLYDPRSGQRRPVSQIQWGDCPFTSISLTSREHQAVAGNSKGCMGLFDFRGKGESKLVHLYRGFAGSISSVECNPTYPYVASCGIDRFVRLHHIQTKEQLHKIYCKARLNCLLLSNDLSISRSTEQRNEGGESDAAYHSDEDRAESDDEVWNAMKRVNDQKKAKRTAGSTSEGDSTEEKAKPKRKKKRSPLVAKLPMKRGSDHEESDEDSEDDGNRRSGKKRMRKILTAVPGKRPHSPRSSPELRKKKRTIGEKTKRKRKLVDSDVIANFKRIEVG